MAQNTEQKEMTQVTTKHTKENLLFGVCALRSSGVNYWFGFAEGRFVKAFRADLEHVSNV